MVESYNKCLQQIKLHCPVKLSPLIQFLKQMALTAREKQETAFRMGETSAKFPQVFFQATVLTSGIVDDIDDVVKIFDQSQWACLPIQVNFVNVFQSNLPRSELDTVKLEKQINKYNNEIAGWRQLQIFFMDRKKPDLRPLSL
mgnify:CR=1 FL=1